ncbi:MAG TPA: RNA polymerase sigma factor [Ktedonobacteraceae bacterium]|nr:RNA polymerase sigma factor [Ktedonobacteraceae bacterium]
MQDRQHEIVTGLLPEDLEDMLEAARPRLHMLALAQHVAPDAVEDVVQETCFEAWRHLERLISAEFFDAWLNGICRNVCLRWLRKAGHEQEHRVLWPEKEDEFAWDFPDPYLPDPGEELIRQDLELLLDRALGYLPAEARRLVELRYLEDLPNHELALRMGVNSNVVGIRLMRARRLLKEVLRVDLREEAEAFGLPLDQEMARGWRKSRVWCFLCGQQFLEGTFESSTTGKVNLRMRCPACSPPQNVDIVSLGGLDSLGKLRSFLPAFKRLQVIVSDACLQAVTQPVFACHDCGSPARYLGVEPVECGFPYQRRYCLSVECSRCGKYILSSVFSAVLAHPEVQKFIARYPRWLNQPEDQVTYNSLSVIRVRLFDVLGTAKLSLFVYPQTLQVLGTLLE